MYNDFSTASSRPYVARHDMVLREPEGREIATWMETLPRDLFGSGNLWQWTSATNNVETISSDFQLTRILNNCPGWDSQINHTWIWFILSAANVYISTPKRINGHVLPFPPTRVKINPRRVKGTIKSTIGLLRCIYDRTIDEKGKERRRGNWCCGGLVTM